MPIYSVQGPDGRIYDVEGPAGASEAAILNFARRQYLMSSPAPTEQPKAGFSLSDLVTSVGQGAVGSTKALTDVAGAGNVASQQLEAAGEALQKRLTPARQAELQRQQERARQAAESGSTWEEIKAAAQSVAEAPLQSAAQAVGSFIPYIPTMFLGPGAAALGLGARATAAATAVARAAPAAIGTAQGAGAVKGAIYERVYQAELQDGTPEEQARAKATAAQNYFGQNVDQIALGAGAGYVAGKFGAERLLRPGAAATAERSALGRVGTALATDVPTEAFQGGQEQLAGNLALQREGRDVSTFQGVAGQATQEGLMGALGAAPVAAVRGPSASVIRAEEEQTRAKAAAAEETRKNTPEALTALDDSYRAALQQMAALNSAVAEKPKKGSTPEEKTAYAEAVRARDAFNRDEFLPLKREYETRRPQIDALYAEQTAATEAEFAGQPTAAKPLPSDIPGAQPFETVPPVRLMEQYDQMRTQFGALEDRMVAATPEEYADLFPQYQTAKQKLDELGKAVEAKGGTTETMESLTKLLDKETAKFKKLQEAGDFEGAKKQADKLAELRLKMPLLEEKQAGLEKRGETRPLFEGVEPQPDTAAQADILEEERSRALYGPESEKARAEQQAAPTPKQTEVIRDTGTGDIFSDFNILQTAFQNGDQRVLDALSRAAEQKKRQTADEAAQERRRLAEILERRLDAEGVKRERANLFDDLFDAKARAEFKNGTYQNKELQKIYDEQGVAAVE